MQYRGTVTTTVQALTTSRSAGLEERGEFVCFPFNLNVSLTMKLNKTQGVPTPPKHPYLNHWELVRTTVGIQVSLLSGPPIAVSKPATRAGIGGRINTILLRVLGKPFSN